MSVFAPTEFPDGISITYNSNSELQAVGIIAQTGSIAEINGVIGFTLQQGQLTGNAFPQLWQGIDTLFHIKGSTSASTLIPVVIQQTVSATTTSPALVVGSGIYTQNSDGGSPPTINTIDDGNGNSINYGSISPGNSATAGVQSHLFSGTGTPQGKVSGTAGDFYFNVTGGAGTYIYVCTGTTSWTGIV